MELTLEQAIQQAVTHHKAGELSAAEHIYRAILAAHPNHADANHNLGVLAVQLKRPADGLPFFKAALVANPNVEQYWLSYIDALVLTDQDDAARSVLEQGQQRGLLNANALAALIDRLNRKVTIKPQQIVDLDQAVLHREAGRYKDALLILHSWLASNPPSAIAYALLAQILSLEKQDEPAWSALNTALSINPGLPIVRRNHARLLFKQKRFAEALREAEAAYQSDVVDPENHLILAVALDLNGQSERAVQFLESAIKNRPNYSEALFNRAMFKIRSNDLAGALDDAERAASLKPHLPSIWGIVGNLRFQLKNLTGAIEALDKALGYEPNNIDYLVSQGDFRRQAGAVEIAISLLEKATSLAPENPGAWVNLGVALQQAERVSDAKFAYAKALDISPNQAEVANNLGGIARDNNDWEEALSYFNQALAINPTLAEAHNNHGMAHHNLDRTEEAKISYRRALEIRPNYAAALCNLGDTLYFLDDCVQSALTYQKAFDIDPSSNIALEAAVHLALISYLNGNRTRIDHFLKIAAPIYTGTSPNLKPMRTYWNYLRKLHTWHLQSEGKFHHGSDTEVLYVIGESHSLSAHNMAVRYKNRAMRCKAELIMGIKQWHLGIDKPNRFKHKFESIIARIPANSTILLSVGEIDCRHDEGILRALRKSPEKSLIEMVQATVDSYISYVARATTRGGHKMIISGVPCPNIQLNKLDKVDADQLIQLIRTFNTTLMHRVLSAGMDFLDVYALTDRGDGIANGQMHIDEFHLLPTSVVEAFDGYCRHQTD